MKETFDRCPDHPWELMGGEPARCLFCAQLDYLLARLDMTEYVVLRQGGMISVVRKRTSDEGLQ